MFYYLYIFKSKGKFINLHFTPLKKIKIFTQPSHHLQNSINFSLNTNLLLHTLI